MADNVRVSKAGALVVVTGDTDQVRATTAGAMVLVRQKQDDVRATMVGAMALVARPWPTTYAYRVKDQHGQTLFEDDDVVPQPRTSGVQVTRRVHSVSGGAIDEFLYVEMLFSSLESVTQYRSVLSQFGVLSAMTNEVTVMCRDATLQWATYNGTAVQPAQGADVQYSRYYPRDVVILIRDLELLD